MLPRVVVLGVVWLFYFVVRLDVVVRLNIVVHLGVVVRERRGRIYYQFGVAVVQRQRRSVCHQRRFVAAAFVGGWLRGREMFHGSADCAQFLE